MKKICSSVLFLLFALLFTSCSYNSLKQTDCFAMDTVITLKAGGKNAETALDAATDEIYRLHRLFSITDSNSDIYRLNNGQSDVSQETAALVSEALAISAATDGAYDCTVSPLMRLWGWYDDNLQVPDAAAIQSALAHTGWQHVNVSPQSITFSNNHMAIDLGGIAKGYAADCVESVMRTHGVSSALINLGGNICVVGSKPDGKSWVIGIDDPDQSGAYLATVSVQDCSVVTSGTYQRFFQQDGKTWHHLLDPQTGYPVENGLRLVTVICEDNTLADGLSTALFVMGQSQATAFWRSGVYDFEAVFVADNGAIAITEGLEDRFSCDKDYEVIVH